MSGAVRIGALSLIRYGAFADTEFRFEPAEAGDLHVIVGANEAGKTTLRSALVDTLFGVPQGTPYKFDGAPRIAASLEIDGTLYDVERRANAAKLRPAEAADALAAALGGPSMTRQTFLAAQALSQRQMLDDAEKLAGDGGDLRDLLLRSAAGLKGVAALEKVLSEESAALFTKDGRNKTNRVRVLRRDWSAAEEAYVEALVPADDVVALEREIEEAETALAHARTARNTARTEREHLQRVQANAGSARRIGEIAAERARGPSHLMAPGATERVSDLVDGLAQAAAAVERLKRHREALDERRAALPQDTDALERSAETARLLRDAEGRETRQAEAARAAAAQQAEITAALRRARDAGLTVDAQGLDGFVAALPSEAARRAAVRHLRRRKEVEQAAHDAAEALAAVDELKNPPEIPEPDPTIADLLRRVAALGDVSATLATHDGNVRRAADALAAAARARDGDGDANAPPPAEEGVLNETRIAQAQQRHAVAAAKLSDAEADVARKTAELEQAFAGEVPTNAAVRAARDARDAAFQRFLASPTAQGRAEVERLIGVADALADQRFEGADAIAKANALQLAIANRDAAAAAVATAQAALDEAQNAWQARLAECGLARVPADYQAWLTRREAHDAAERAHRAASDEREAYLADAEMAAAACGAFVHNLDDAAPIAERLGKARAALDQMKSDADGAAADARRAQAAYTAQKEARPALADANDAAHDTLADWTEDWAAHAKTCSVSLDASEEALDDLFAAHRDITAAHDRALDHAQRGRAAEAAEAKFEADARALGAALGEAAEGAYTLAERLGERLTAAQAAKAEEARLTEEIDTTSQALEAEQERHDEIRGKLGRDIAAAGLPDDAPAGEVREAARQSDSAHALEAERQRLADQVSSAGLTVEELTEAIASATDAEREAALEHLAEREAEHAQKADDLLSEVSRLKKALADLTEKGGQANAAFHRTTQVTIEGELAKVAAEAIRLRAQLAVLTAARERFARTMRSPVLERASSIFAALTGGRYDALVAGAGEAFVEARRASDGAELTVDALSAGTRDQLVLSVRLAAAHDSALPFIADDLFVNWDDMRAQAGFATLAELSAGRQVFYLTHHQHLEEIARRAAPGAVRITNLDAHRSAAVPA